MNFTFNIEKPKDGEWGILQINGSWTGMVGMLTKQEIDFGTLYNKIISKSFQNHFKIISKSYKTRLWIFSSLLQVVKFSSRGYKIRKKNT